MHGPPASPAEQAVTPSFGPSGTAPTDEIAFMCIEKTDNPHCAGRVRIEAAFPPDRDGSCEYDETEEFCSMEILAPTTTQVRLALRRAGIAAAVLRTARADDPAPVGSVLLAVPAGPACLLAYDDGDGLQQSTAGQLPEGTCLPR